MLYTAGGRREMDGWMNEWMNAGVGREARPDQVDGKKRNGRDSDSSG